MNELFNIEQVKSPRLLWIEKHKINYRANSEDKSNFIAWQGDELPKDRTKIGYGETVEDAYFRLAKALKIRMWNEEKYIETKPEKIRKQ